MGSLAKFAMERPMAYYVVVNVSLLLPHALPASVFMTLFLDTSRSNSSLCAGLK